MTDASTSGSMSPELMKVVERAQREPEGRFHSLAHLIDVPTLLRAYHRIRKDGAVGVDGVTKEQYGQKLQENLESLHRRLKAKQYRHQPIRRVHIPKDNGKTRPIGISAFEDRVVQDAIREVLQAIYEQDFLDCSHGFRPGRSAHDAIRALDRVVHRGEVNWILEADIVSFFDSLDRTELMKLIQIRVADGSLLRLIGKCLHVGVLDGADYTEPEKGTIQGSGLSPLLGNIYLHYVLDLWVCQWRKRHARGEVYAVRYADDLVMGFQREQDALDMRSALAGRLAKFGLELHPDKTRVLEFGRFAREGRERRGLSKPETFDFLGFTHIVGQDRRGKFQLRRRTSRKKRRAKLAVVKEECRRRRHWRVAEQHAWLSSVLRGHYQYYGVPTNSPALASFRRAVGYLWHASLQRRSQRARWTRPQLRHFEERYPLPPPHVVHPWPDKRFATR